MPIDCPCYCHQDEHAAVALAERMLDTAEGAGVDLRELELRRRRLKRDMADYDALVDRFGPVAGRAQELRESIELGVDVLAEAFVYLRGIVEGAERGARH
jgi:hypothetical protein